MSKKKQIKMYLITMLTLRQTIVKTPNNLCLMGRLSMNPLPLMMQ